MGNFNFGPVETGLLVVIIGAFLGIVASMITKGIGSAQRYMKDKTNNDFLKTIIASVGDSAKYVVQSLNQTLVDELKEKSADGKLSKEDIVEINKRALQTLKNTLSEEAKTLLGTVFGNVEGFLQMILEAKVSEVKSERNKKPVIVQENPELADVPLENDMEPRG